MILLQSANPSTAEAVLELLEEGHASTEDDDEAEEEDGNEEEDQYESPDESKLSCRPWAINLMPACKLAVKPCESSRSDSKAKMMQRCSLCRESSKVGGQSRLNQSEMT